MYASLKELVLSLDIPVLDYYPYDRAWMYLPTNGVSHPDALTKFALLLLPLLLLPSPLNVNICPTHVNVHDRVVSGGDPSPLF